MQYGIYVQNITLTDAKSNTLNDITIIISEKINQ